MVKKKNRKAIGIVGVILALGLLFFATGNFFTVTGVTTLAISKVDLQSYNVQLLGKAWLIQFSSGGLGQSYYGSFRAGEIEDEGSQSTKDFSISVEYEDEICEYPITKTGSLRPIYGVLEYKFWGCLYPRSNIEYYEENSGFGTVLLYGGRSDFSFTCFAVGTNEIHPAGIFGQTNVNQPYTITINVGDRTANKTINPLKGSSQGSIGDFAYVSWAGNLVSGVGCPNTQDYRPVYVSNNWRTVNKQSYDSYVVKLNNFPTGNPSRSVVVSWMDAVNSFSSRAKVSESFGFISNSASEINAIVKIKTPSPVQFPVTTLYIKAETLGIYTPVPDIIIDSASSNCFKSGEQGIISVGLKNVGDEGGTFKVYAICDNPFSITQSISGSLVSGESRTVNIPLSASVSQKTTANCITYVESTGERKSKSVGVCADPQIVCTLSYPKTFCGIYGGVDVVKQCSIDGGRTNIIETCNSNEYCEQGECKEKGIVDDECAWYDLPCKIKKLFAGVTSFLSGVTAFFMTLKYILVAIGSLFFFLFGKNILERIIKKKDKTSIFLVWAISILLGLLVGYILYKVLFSWYFWLILIGVIILNFFITLFPIPKIFKIRRRR